MQQPADDDDTIALHPPDDTVALHPAVVPVPRSRLPMWMIAAPVMLAVLGTAGGGWLFWRPDTPPPPARVALRAEDPAPQIAPAPEPTTPTSLPAEPQVPIVVAPPQPVAPEATRGMILPLRPDQRVDTASEQNMLEHTANDTSPAVTVFRFKANPRILVLDFASLRDQGRMLNRAAALVEKAGLPRDRLLNDAELDQAVHAAGDTMETFYYGHDYGASALARFFTLADRANIRLTAEEESLRQLLRRDGWFEPNTSGALISIPQIGADDNVTPRARATILHHELSHGEYFTNPAYAAFVRHFWKQTLTEAERQQIRTHLRALGYDPTLDDLMENEAQAYLMFTDNPEFFTPDMAGMTKGRLGELRNGFYRAMPLGWLRDSLGATLNLGKGPPPGRAP